MGLKDWIAGNVAGPQLYGNTMGPQAREAGSALANVVFMSHGIHPAKGPTSIFDSVEVMKAAGFIPRFAEIKSIDLEKLNTEELAVLKSLQTTMISFVFILNSNGALQYMRRDNTSKFRNGFGPSLLKAMVDCHLYENIESARTELLSNIKSFEASGIQSVLNMDKPACGDLLEHFIVRAVKVAEARLRYGFSRTGSTGFDVVAVPLAEETIKSIAGATQKYNW